MKKKIVCPLCGSDRLKKIEKNSVGQVTLGDDFSFKEIYFQCNVCQEEFDLLGETDKFYKEAEKKAQQKFVEKTIKELKQNYKMSFFERVFELPIRTLSRWKSGDFSQASLALLRIFKTYPWMVKVAEHKFEKSFARNMLVQQAAKSSFSTSAADTDIGSNCTFGSGYSNGIQLAVTGGQ